MISIMDMEFTLGEMVIDMKVGGRKIVEKVKEHGFGDNKVHHRVIDILANGMQIENMDMDNIFKQMGIFTSEHFKKINVMDVEFIEH